MIVDTESPHPAECHLLNKHSREYVAVTDVFDSCLLCACFGGVQAIRNFRDNDIVKAAAYGKNDMKKIPEIKVHPLNKIVQMDHYLLECPVNKYDFLNFVKYFLVGGTPKLPNMPVCQQCKAKENRCILIYVGFTLR